MQIIAQKVDGQMDGRNRGSLNRGPAARRILVSMRAVPSSSEHHASASGGWSRMARSAGSLRESSLTLRSYDSSSPWPRWSLSTARSER